MKNFLIVLVCIVLTSSFVYVVKKQDTSLEQNIVADDSKKSDPVVSTKNRIDLSGQNLTLTPMYIFEKINTEELDLSNNNLTGALPSQVGNLKKLKVLNLSNNKFTGVPAEIGHINTLEILNLSNNNITGLPIELGELSNLKLLDLSGNTYSKQDLDIIKSKLPSSTIIKI